MRASADRSVRFVFDGVADAYLAGRLDLPLDAVRWGLDAAGVRDDARVLEIGAGGGQLTVTLLEAGLDVVALEPGDALRARAVERAPAARFVASTFEGYEAGGRFDAVVSANAFHWLDPASAYPRAAELADALVLLWDTPFPADPALFARLQREVMRQLGSTFPDTEAGVRAFVESDSAVGRDELRASGRFAEPVWRVFDRTVRFTPARFAALMGTLSTAAARRADERERFDRDLRAVLGEEPFDVLDLVYVVASRTVR